MTQSPITRLALTQSKYIKLSHLKVSQVNQHDDLNDDALG